jgi:hypothetical protein
MHGECAGPSATVVKGGLMRYTRSAKTAPWKRRCSMRKQSSGMGAHRCHTSRRLDDQVRARRRAESIFLSDGPDPQCRRDDYARFTSQYAFFKNALTANHWLRQRVAFALSRILVTSSLDVNPAYTMGKYQQILRDCAFGNYEDILIRVTSSPLMGCELARWFGVLAQGPQHGISEPCKLYKQRSRFLDLNVQRAKARQFVCLTHRGCHGYARTCSDASRIRQRLSYRPS